MVSFRTGAVPLFIVREMSEHNATVHWRRQECAGQLLQHSCCTGLHNFQFEALQLMRCQANLDAASPSTNCLLSLNSLAVVTVAISSFRWFAPSIRDRGGLPMFQRVSHTGCDCPNREKTLSDFQPVDVIVRAHQSLQFVPPIVSGRSQVDLSGQVGPLHQSNGDIAVKERQPLPTNTGVKMRLASQLFRWTARPADCRDSTASCRKIKGAHMRNLRTLRTPWSSEPNYSNHTVCD